MPELPEVETVVQDLKPKILGEIISKIFIYKDSKHTLSGNLIKISKEIENRKIKNVTRRAKYIVLNLDNGKLLTIHLRMTGRILVGEKLTEDKLNHCRARIDFKSSKSLYFKDVRKFGRIEFWQNPELLENKLGVEPLSKNFTLDYLVEVLANSKKKIKSFLLDQSKIAGLGNIYVDEVLWSAKIKPDRISNEIGLKEAVLMHGAIKKILKQAIFKNGTTFDSFYFGTENSKKGENSNNLNVFDREGQSCKRCKSKIIKIKLAQRGTHFCNKCQK